jgi:hypothetical protein
MYRAETVSATCLRRSVGICSDDFSGALFVVSLTSGDWSDIDAAIVVRVIETLHWPRGTLL